MKTYLSLLFFFLVISTSLAQTMYRDSLFAEVNQETYFFDTELNTPLAFDFYRAGEDEGRRPLLIYVHGGGFAGGQRDSEDIVDFAQKIAQRGYAVASVSYRLTMQGIGFGCDVEAQKKIATIDTAAYDVSLSVQYLLDHAKEFKIDPQNIILAGGSAGAETVLNMVYGYKDPNLPEDFRYAGVIGMAGAITNLDRVNAQSAIPTQLFHGTSDPLVPYGTAAHHFCEETSPGYLKLYGSESIANRLKDLGSTYYLYTIQGGSHLWADLPKLRCLDEISDFLYHDVLKKGSFRQSHRVIADKSSEGKK